MDMPQVTLGVYRQRPAVARDVIARALSIGYRSIDTASYYGNEAAVGDAVRTSGLPRDEMFVTSKLWNSDQGRGALDAFHRSLELTGLDYLDCYLLHWPVRGLFEESWERLQPAREQGLVKHLGVSNFLPRHLDALGRTGVDYLPYVNQVEMHPYLLPDEILDHDRALGIRTSSWSPLGNGHVLRDPVLAEIGRAHGKSASQVALRWATQKDVLVIPKATGDRHLRENLEILDFTLDAGDMARIDALNRDEHTDWDPAHA